MKVYWIDALFINRSRAKAVQISRAIGGKRAHYNKMVLIEFKSFSVHEVVDRVNKALFNAPTYRAYYRIGEKIAITPAYTRDYLNDVMRGCEGEFIEIKKVE